MNPSGVFSPFSYFLHLYHVCIIKHQHAIGDNRLPGKNHINQVVSQFGTVVQDRHSCVHERS